MGRSSSPGRASVLDLARQAKVSPATVSRAFSQPELVAPATLARIREVAQTLNFRPNRVGRSLRSGRTRTIGLVLPTLANPVFAECLEGAEQRARQDGYSVMVTTTHYDPAREASAVQDLIDHQVDGLILTVGRSARNACLQALRAEGPPYILAYNESASHPFVSVDNRAAAAEVVDLLASHGHQRLAFVSGPLEASDRARSRLEGAAERAQALGLAPLAHVLMPAHTASDAARLSTLMRAKNAPTALFCSNDLLAVAVIADLSRLGLTVPQKVSVCGFDGMAFGELLAPALTTQRQPNQAIGEHACAALLATIGGSPAPARFVRLPHELIVGGTVAAYSPAVPSQKRDRS